MNGMIVVVVAAVVLAAGYLLYGRWLARTWGIDREALTPAKRMEDGKNFSPASCFTAFSHQFSSICGAGPVTGTIAAMMFGWLPVVLWVLVGGIFFGAVHDFGALYASVKNNGKSLAQLVEKYIGRTGRRLFLLFSWLFTIIVIAAFVDMVAGTFMTVANAQTGAVDFAASYAGGAAGTISILFTFVAIAFGWINRRFGLTGWREFVLAVALFVAMFAVGMQFPVYLDKLGWFAVIMVYLLFAAATGSQLDRWYRDNRFCGRCGAPTELAPASREIVCPECAHIVYPKICPGVICAVTSCDGDDEKIVLTRYAGRTTALWALVAGFTEIGEPLEDTVRREVMEEVGLSVKNLRFYKSQPWSFTDTLLVGFWCEVDGDPTIAVDRSELKEARWFSRDEMPLERTGDRASLTGEMIERFRLMGRRAWE